MSAYADLVARGCLCGGDDPASCPIHTEPADNRGIAAFFKAGMPRAFPAEHVTCGVCGSNDCLLYPDPGEDDGAPQVHRPSVVCPNCSTPACESFLRYRAEEQGFELKPVCVFTTATRLVVESSTSSRLDDAPLVWEPITDPDEQQRALANLAARAER